MRTSALVAILFSAAVFASPIQEAEQSTAVGNAVDIPEFNSYAEWVQWAETADFENMDNWSIGKFLKKGLKFAKKIGGGILKHGPQILDTITKVAGGAGDAAPAVDASADAGASAEAAPAA